jgi:hypothetical protein
MIHDLRTVPVDGRPLACSADVQTSSIADRRLNVGGFGFGISNENGDNGQSALDDQLEYWNG